MPKAQTPASLTVDFTNVADRREGGGKAAHVPPGDYLLQVVGCEKRPTKDDPGGPGYLSWKTAIVSPEKHAKAGYVYFVTSLKEEALWNLRNFIEDLGIKVPKSSVKIPIQTIVQKKLIFGATLDDDTYNDKTKSKVQATFNKKEYEATDEEEEEEGGSAEVDETEDEEEVSDDEDLEELDVDDL